MKQITFLIFWICISMLHVKAQETHDWVIGGSLSGSKFKFITTSDFEIGSSSSSSNPNPNVRTNITNGFSVSLNPYLAKRYNCRSMLGFGIMSNYESSDFAAESQYISGNGNSRILIIGLESFYRHYFQTGNKIDFFTQVYFSVNTSFGQVDYRSSNGSETREHPKDTNFKTGISLGSVYAISKRWSILISLPALEYQHQDHKNDRLNYLNTNSSIRLNTSLKNIHIGIEHKF